jgi:hypothetical protein
MTLNESTCHKKMGLGLGLGSETVDISNIRGSRCGLRRRLLASDDAFWPPTTPSGWIPIQNSNGLLTRSQALFACALSLRLISGPNKRLTDMYVFISATVYSRTLILLSRVPCLWRGGDAGSRGTCWSSASTSAKTMRPLLRAIVVSDVVVGWAGGWGSWGVAGGSW